MLGESQHDCCNHRLHALSSEVCLQTAMRVWDALLSEGTKLLYRVALALLKTHEDRLMAQDNAGYVQREMKLASAAMHDRDTLLKVRGMMACDAILSVTVHFMQGLRCCMELQTNCCNTLVGIHHSPGNAAAQGNLLAQRLNPRHL